MTLPALALVDAALRGALLASLLLVGAAIARTARTQVVAPVGVAFAFGLAVQTVASIPAVERGLPILAQAPLVAVSLGNAVLFWIFVAALVDDAFRLRPLHAAIWLAAAGVGAGFCVSMAAFGPAAPVTEALRIALRAMPALFAVLVVAAAAADWRVDLVERRRGLRAFIVVAGSIYALSMLAVRMSAPHGVPSPAAASLDTAALLAMVVVVGLAVLRVDGAAAVLPRPAPAIADPAASAVTDPAAPDPPDPRLAAALDRLMSEDRAYRIDDLTLGVLALKLGVPEYRLRRHIHQQLGHRNFNAYVNGLRLDEVRAALADPARREAGILEIALAAGFASAGPFNRAFKAATGMTPTEFRQRALADS